ncbi:efflux transporter outer membrane subunit [Xylophilus rhododendri]
MRKKTFPLAALAAAALLLSGCSLIPTYERPAAPVEASFPPPPAIDGAQPQAATGAVASELSYQQFFADPRLVQLVGIALSSNRDLRATSLAIEQARAQFQITRANQYPAVGLAANASRAPNVINGALTNSFQVGLAVTSWEIDFFGRLQSLKEQALATYLASEEGRRAAQTSLVAGVANGWLALQADEELLDLSRRTVATREDSVRLTKLRLDNGVSSALDFQQADSLAQSARATLAQAQRQRALDENSLVLLLGQPLPADIRSSLAGDRLADVPPFPALQAGLPSDLLVRRPDIRQSEQQLIAANANIGAARAAFFPRISLTAQAGTASNELSGLFKSGSSAFSIAPSLVLPIFDAGRNRAGLASSEAGRDIAVAQYEKSIQTAFREVADALAGDATLAEQLRALQAQAQAESGRFELSDLRYRNGVATYLDLLDAQRSLFGAQQAVVQTRLLQRQNQVSLYKALGGGWTDQPEMAASAASSSPATR